MHTEKSRVYASPVQGEAYTRKLSVCNVNLIYCKFFVLSSRVTTTNSGESEPQPLFFDHTVRSEQREALFQNFKRNTVITTNSV